MNKAALKTFATEARKQLMADTRYRAERLGIYPDSSKTIDPIVRPDGSVLINSESPVILSDSENRQRSNLIKRIDEVGYEQVIEEVAYTWFNRLIAIRYMEIHDYLPFRVLSSSEGTAESDLMRVAPDIDNVKFSPDEIAKILDLKEKNKVDDLFKFLFIWQCDQLNTCLPVMFQKTEDYTNLLFPLSFTNPNGTVKKLVQNVSEDDFRSVEIIGWMYQYYNTELKDETFKRLKQNQKITKERIPSATQLFTPEWIVRYMVENSLGRIWYEGHPDNSLKSGWKYYLDEVSQSPDVESELKKIRVNRASLSPEDLTIIDPCMGSGHILVYAFDVLMQIYVSVGYQKSDATRLILEKNLYGVDIDDRAGQLAYFAVMMKAREYNRRIFDEKVTPHLCSIQESNIINDDNLSEFAHGNLSLYQHLVTLRDVFRDAKEYGSLLTVSSGIDFAGINKLIAEGRTKTWSAYDWFKRLADIVRQAEILSHTYDGVVTNPPYMGNGGMNQKLSAFVKDKYPNSKSDLCTCFIEKCKTLTNDGTYFSMITQQSWMFLTSFEKFRNKLISASIINMVHFGPHAFDEIGGEVVQSTSFVIANHNIRYKGLYLRLIEPKSEFEKEQLFLSGKNRYLAVQDNFTAIPGSPIAYWVSEKFIEIFDNKENIGTMTTSAQGIVTGDNEKYLKLWYEIDYDKIAIDIKSVTEFDRDLKKYAFCNKGGPFRKWYGNNDYVVLWSESDKFSCGNASTYNDLLFIEGITWTGIYAGKFSARYYPNGFVFESGGPSFFADTQNNLFYYLGLCNSSYTNTILNIITPTLNAKVNSVRKIPVILSKKYYNEVVNKTKENISISKQDWDSFETSWEFQTHPFLAHKGSTVKESFENWQKFADTQFFQLKANEEELNRIFIEIYGLQDELTPAVEEKDVTIRRADRTRDVKSFISYAVGCMFGRYSLDHPGLVFAGGDFDETKYQTFTVDKDGILPITDRDYFDDDIVGLFIAFLKATYGRETLEENLSFIADSLPSKGSTSRDVLRTYFLKDFYKDHLKIYQKRPIYWLFDSGKENGFKALIYLHRYNKDTVGRVRTDYLHEIQHRIEAERQRAVDRKATGTSVQQRKATDEISLLTKQLEETVKYDEALATIALQRIDLDLDDGVAVNYAKFQNIDIGDRKKTVDLLGKIS